MGRLFAQQYGGNAEAVATDFADFWRGIVEAIDRHKPSVVVLSAESLFGLLGEVGPAPLRSMLTPLGAQTEVVCYVRRPSDYYLSMAQQQLKASAVIRPVSAVAYRRSIEAAVAAVDRVHLVPYERSLFPGGDIVADFAARFMPEAAGELRPVEEPEGQGKHERRGDGHRAGVPQRAPSRRQRPFHARHRRADAGGSPDAKSSSAGSAALSFLPQVRELIDQSSVDLIWLRDAFGIVFGGIDYAAIAAAPGFRPKTVADICIVDPERREALAGIAATQLAVPVDDPAGKKFRAVPGRRDKP